VTVISPSAAVKVRGLKKRFGSFWALRGLDLDVPRGAFYAFLGPNGAGKSTTLAVLTGLYAADEGTVEILGENPLAKALEVKARIGIVPEELALFERLTGEQHLTFCARMYGLSPAEAEQRADELLRLTDLTDKRRTLIAAYSKGMRRRLAIAAALIHAPELVFLDEPFEGIDVLAAGVIRELLRELSRQGVTLVLTTHVLEIAERLATHAGIICEGKLLDQGSIPDLLARYQAPRLEQVFEGLIRVPVSKNARLSFYGEAPDKPLTLLPEHNSA
jgi:ABC-2 type transport system ATP-binding protein